MDKQMDKETSSKFEELQVLEQNSQALFMQKQAFQMELSETENALEEVKKTNSEVYKIVGQIMIKTTKQETEKELSHKKNLLSLRMKSIEKQEQAVSEKLSKLREEVAKKFKQEK